MSERVIGTCGKCGGKVTVPDAWYGMFPPEPTCAQCGRRKKCTLPVIEMEEHSPATQHAMDMIKQAEKKS